MKKNNIVLLAVLAFSFLLFSCVNGHKPSNNAPDDVAGFVADTQNDTASPSEPPDTAGEYELGATVKYTDEDYIRELTHVILAEYQGMISMSFCGDAFAFAPLELWKGEISDETIYVRAEDSPVQSIEDLKPGDTMVLVAERRISVYWDTDLYFVSCILKNDPTEKARVEKILSSGITKANFAAYSGTEYVHSDDLQDVIEQSKFAFVVEIGPVSAGGEHSSTHKCSVLASVRGQPELQEIHIRFFKGDVEPGETYLVFLSENVDHSILYTLSSRNSVFQYDEALEIEALKELLDQAESVVAPTEMTFEEMLQAELEAAG